MEKRIRLDGETPSEKGLELLAFLLKNIKGQDRAVKHLVNAIEIFESGLFTKGRPIYVNLASGPSGVGKTLTAEVLAEYWFGDRNAFTKIACETYSESHSICQLTGSPAGYQDRFNPKDARNPGIPPVLWQGNIDQFALNIDPELIKARNNFYDGVEAEGDLNYELANRMANISELFDDKGEISVERFPALIKKIKESFPIIAEREKIITEVNKLAAIQAFTQIKRPKSIILFDEIEKAHPALHNILLNIIDKAQFQLSNGMITDFSNSVIIMTTNVGSRAIADFLKPKKNPIGYTGSTSKEIENADEEIYKIADAEIKKFFVPEFLGRIDKISVYRPLNPEILKDIVDVELRRFQEEILKGFPIILRFDEKVKNFILKESLDKPDKGARLIKQKVREYLTVPLCRIKNKGQIKENQEMILTLDEAGEKPRIVFEKEEEENKEEKKD